MEWTSGQIAACFIMHSIVTLSRTGPVVDQAALHGLLRKVCDLGMPLLSVNRIEPRQTDEADVKS